MNFLQKGNYFTHKRQIQTALARVSEQTHVAMETEEGNGSILY